MNILRKRSTAVAVTVVLIVLAVIIGIGKAPADGGGKLLTNLASGNKAPNLSSADRDWYVVDGADVLSSSTERNLQNLNQQLYRDMDVIIAVVTSGKQLGDLYEYALDAAEDMKLKEYDFVVVLDMAAERCQLVQGNGLVDVFTDADCLDYVDRYMMDHLYDGDYDEAALDLAQALSQWYYANYIG